MYFDSPAADNKMRWLRKLELRFIGTLSIKCAAKRQGLIDARAAADYHRW